MVVRAESRPPFFRYRVWRQLLLPILMAVGAGAAVTVGRVPAIVLLGVMGIAAVWALDEPQAVLYLILAVIFIDRSPVVVHQSYVRLYQVMAIPILMKWVALRVSRRERPIVPKGWVWALLWIGSFFFAWPVLISRTEFFVELLGMTFLLAIQIVVFDTIERYGIRDRAFLMLTYGAILVMLSGMGQYLLFLAHILHPETFGGFVRPYGLMREPDWYGVESGITLLLLIFQKDRFSPRTYGVFVFLAIVGVVSSLARASWLSSAVALLVLALVPGPQQVEARRIVGMGIKAVALMMAGLCVFDLHELLRVIARVSPINLGIGGTARLYAEYAWASRLASIKLMQVLIGLHPWFGNGAGVMGKLSLLPSIQNLYSGGGQLNTGRATTNIFLGQAASVGIVGTIPFVVWFIQGIVRGFRNPNGPIFGAILLLCAVDFEFNSGIGYGFFWVFMGLATLPQSSASTPAPESQTLKFASFDAPN